MQNDTKAFSASLTIQMFDQSYLHLHLNLIQRSICVYFMILTWWSILILFCLLLSSCMNYYHQEILLDKLLERRQESSRLDKISCLTKLCLMIIKYHPVLGFSFHVLFICSLPHLCLCLKQRGVPAFTVPQPDEAMLVLEEKASELDVSQNFSYIVEVLVSFWS